MPASFPFSLARTPLVRGLLVAASPFLVTPSSSAEAQPPSTQQTRLVAVLETRAPDSSEFLLRGTLPVPPGTFPRTDGLNPLTILDYNGSALFTQTEIVSRYASESAGADVVELIARVRRDPSLAPGAPARYAVIFLHPSPPRLESLEPMLEEVDDLLLADRGVEITTYDCFGNVYVSRPFAGPTGAVLHRGPVLAEVRTNHGMRPRPEVPGSTLRHFFGVHSYVSWSRGSPVVGLSVRFHNAHDGHDPTTDLDDPLDKVYFQRIEISMPEGWVLQQDFADPLFGRERIVAGRRIVALVDSNPGGGLHVMRWGGQFHRRLALAPARPAAVRAARDYLDGVGRAFCTRGFDGRGREYWSWWNRETARYFPQRRQLPLLDHVASSALESEITSELATLVAHLRDGTGTGNYPFSSGRLGWGHPYGVPYGGMTSGLEIFCYDGIVAATVASPSGFRLYSALHRMQTDRQSNALYQLDGAPSSVEEWLIENGSADYVPFEHFVVPLIAGIRPDPFGVRNAPRFQADFVAANRLQPPYESRYLTYEPHDFQHFVRYTRSAKVLAWLANDSLAKDDLRMQAESFHLSYHGFANNAFGGAQGSGLLSAIRSVQSVPGKGFAYGRGEAWGLDCAVAAYALSDEEWRARKLPWLMKQAEVVLTGQVACSGFIQAAVSSKALDGKYHARQMIEQSITENALVGLNESVFRDAHPAYAALVHDVLVDSLRAFVSDMAWFPGEPGPWRYTGVAPLARTLPVWCSRADMPGDAWTAGDRETYQDWSSFAYGYELTRELKFLNFARIQAGAADQPKLLEHLELDGTSNLQNQAALLALLQRLAGKL
jgi:hypothetical protein